MAQAEDPAKKTDSCQLCVDHTQANTRGTAKDDPPKPPSSIDIGLRISITVIPPLEASSRKPVDFHFSFEDSVQDLYVALAETPQTCFITSFDLKWNGKTVSRYAEFYSLGIKNRATFEMVHATYNARTARNHLQRFQVILSAEGTNDSGSVFSFVCRERTRKPTKGCNRTDVESLSVEELLPDYSSLPYSSSLKCLGPPDPMDSLPFCLSSLTFSRWNPVSGNRKLMGDLFYLEIQTLEGVCLYVTAATQGFFVNASSEKHFNPMPATPSFPSNTLVRLLSRASFLFRDAFSSIFQTLMRRHQFELYPTLDRVYSWVLTPVVHRSPIRLSDIEGPSRSIDEAEGFFRDWNEEYQSVSCCLGEDVHEKLMRFRALGRICADFVECASKGALAAVHGCLLPSNPLVPEQFTTYVHNNIFYSFASDCFGLYKNAGGFRAARSNANHDLQGVRLLQAMNVEGLHLVATAIVDYRGYRLVAQSMPPGILNETKSNTVLYGLDYSGDTRLAVSSEFCSLMQEIAARLSLTERSVQVGNGPVLSLAGSVECKGILGTDQRRYLLELYRTTPRDANFLSTSESTQLIRRVAVQKYLLQNCSSFRADMHERASRLFNAILLSSERMFPDDAEVEFRSSPYWNKLFNNEERYFFETLCRGEFANVVLSKESKDGEPSSASVDNGSPKAPENEPAGSELAILADSAKNVTECKQLSNADKVEKDQIDENRLNVNLENSDSNRPLMLNPDVLFGTSAPFHHCSPPEELKQDEYHITKLASLVMEKMIPQLVNDLSAPSGLPLDGESLSDSLHERGISLRYLGIIASLVSEESLLRRICLQEMVVRCSKHIFNRILRTIPDALLAPSCAHFLNCLFAIVCGSQLDILPPKPSPPFKALPASQIMKLVPTVLCHKLRRKAKQYFHYSLPQDCSQWVTSAVATIRGFCKQTGIQVKGWDYEFSGSRPPFASSDVLGLYPRIKDSKIRIPEISGLLEAGECLLQLGRHKLAFFAFINAASLINLVHGPIHVELGHCYSQLAMILFQHSVTPQVVDFQEKAVIIYERCAGLDSYLTIRAYHNLGMYYHALGETSRGIRALRRALYLAGLACGGPHPLLAAGLMNLGLMLQSDRNDCQAKDVLKIAINVSTQFYGAKSLSVATIYHAIAISQANLNDFKEALFCERANFSILSELVEENDVRRIESGAFLTRFAACAIETEREKLKLSSKKSVVRPEAPSSNRRPNDSTQRDECGESAGQSQGNEGKEKEDSGAPARTKKRKQRRRKRKEANGSTITCTDNSSKDVPS